MTRIVFCGNCQASALWQTYRDFVSPIRGDEAKYVDLFSPLSAVGRADLAAADLIVAQVITKQTIDTVNKLPTDAKRVFFPAVAAQFLWPFGCYRHPMNTPVWHRPDGPYPTQKGDGYLNRMINRKIEAHEAVRQYIDLDINAMMNLDRLFEIGIAGQKQRDSLTGYSFASLIEESFRNEYLFRTPDHPNLPLARYFAASVFERLGVGAPERERITRYAIMFPEDTTPIHPAVISHFGLRFVTEESRYRFLHEGSFTFEEYALRYMRNEWNQELDEGITLAARGRSEEALPKLRAGLAGTPASSVGLRALSGIMADRGAREEALDLASRAVRADDKNANAQHWFANLLLRQDELGEAERAVREAVALSRM
jgi:tetratricopeptide (TPR) repeat protein